VARGEIVFEYQLESADGNRHAHRERRPAIDSAAVHPDAIPALLVDDEIAAAFRLQLGVEARHPVRRIVEIDVVGRVPPDPDRPAGQVHLVCDSLTLEHYELGHGYLLRTAGFEAAAGRAPDRPRDRFDEESIDRTRVRMRCVQSGTRISTVSSG